MPTLSALQSRLSGADDVQMKAEGYALWLVWTGEINPVIPQTLEDYGGIALVEEPQQGLWFFFSTEVFLAAARLSVWTRFNSLVMLLQIFPATFEAGEDYSRNIVFDKGFSAQNLTPRSEFQVWAHASLKGQVDAAPGLKLVESPLPEGMTPGNWLLLEADARLPYQSTQGWYALLHPMGNPLEKEFQIGWREFFGQLEAILQRNKFRFAIHDFYLMFPLDSLRQVKSWCRDFFALLQRLKAEASEQYWPCVLAIVERKGLHLSEDLPQKSKVVWEHLVPDYPHMIMRTAFTLGDEFAVHRARFAASQRSPEDWASISLRTADGCVGARVPQIAPSSLIMGQASSCFYCGQSSHSAEKCPSLQLAPLETGIWTELAKRDLASLQESAEEIETELLQRESTEERELYLTGALHKKDATGILLKAFYDIAWPLQFRSINFFWRVRTKDIGRAAKELTPPDHHVIWAALDSFRLKEAQELDKDLQSLALKFPQDFRVLCLCGFGAMERGDLEKAGSFWKEAEKFSPYPAIQAWHLLLQARALECQGKTPQALLLYEQVARSLSPWQEGAYRKLVCDVKCGFIENALAQLRILIERNGHFFNRALIDPELERGYIQVQECLNTLWNTMEQRAREEELNLARMREELASWFTPSHPFAEEAAQRIEKLLQLSLIKNYVPFQKLSQGRAQLEKDMQNIVLQDARANKNHFLTFANRLKVIREESAWFPFPAVLVEFNKSYSQSVANINWAMTANLHVPDSFRKAQFIVEQETERLKKLEGRLRFLRIIRDSTLFILSMAETFFWIELIGIIAIFVVLPLLLLYGDKFGLDVAVSAIVKERWQMQKGLFFMLSVLAVGIASLRTVLRFEQIRDKILLKAKGKNRGSGGETSRKRGIQGRKTVEKKNKGGK